jgi:hypothetical protein
MRKGRHSHFGPLALPNIPEETEQGFALKARFHERTGDFDVLLFGIS